MDPFFVCLSTTTAAAASSLLFLSHYSYIILLIATLLTQSCIHAQHTLTLQHNRTQHIASHMNSVQTLFPVRMHRCLFGCVCISVCVCIQPNFCRHINLVGIRLVHPLFYLALVPQSTEQSRT